MTARRVEDWRNRVTPAGPVDNVASAGTTSAHRPAGGRSARPPAPQWNVRPVYVVGVPLPLASTLMFWPAGYRS